MNTMNPVAYGLIVAVIGIAVVFVMLTILIAFVWTLGKLIQKLVNRAEAKKAAAAAAAAPAPAPAPVVNEPVVEEAPAVDDAELIAVIAAAVAAAMEAAGEESASGFVVRSIRRINNAPAWNRAGREEQVYSRM